MTTAIAFPSLSGGSKAEKFLAAFSNGVTLRSKDLTWVKIPGQGGTTWSWTAGDGTEYHEKSITGLLCVLGPTEWSLWPTNDTGAGRLPLLISTTPGVAYKVSDDYGLRDKAAIEAAKRADGSYDTNKLPQYFAWKGTGKGATPPVAKASRVIGILREGDIFPIFVRLPGTSVRAIEDLEKRLPQSGVLPTQAIIELTLKGEKSNTGIAYSTVQVRAVGKVTDDEHEKVEKLITNVFTSVVAPPAELRQRHEVVEEESSSEENTDDVPF